MSEEDDMNGIGTNADDEVHDIGIDEPEPQKPSSNPALTINIQSWATPVIGLLMLVIGLAAGYFLRPVVSPLLSGEAEPPTPVAAAPTTASATESAASNTSATEQPANLEELMDYLLPQVKHFQGDEQAAVTIIEFSDFQ